MPRAVKVPSGVLVLRRVAATYMPTRKAGAQVHPPVADRNAFSANVGRGCDVTAVGEVFADCHKFSQGLGRSSAT